MLVVSIPSAFAISKSLFITNCLVIVVKSVEIMNPIEQLINYFSNETFNSNHILDISNIIGKKIENTNADNVKEEILTYLEDQKDSLYNKQPNFNYTLDTILNVGSKQYEKYISDEMDEVPNYITINQDVKSKLVYNLLNKDQKYAFLKIHEFLSSSLNSETQLIDTPVTIVLDSPPGTGKSFIIDCLGLTLNWGITAIVRNRVLANTFSKVSTISSKTTCKFQMELFNTDFKTTIKMFKDIKNEDDLLKFIYDIIKNRFTFKDDLLIIDEYSMESPIFLAIIFLMSKIYLFNILIIGDKNQHNTIDLSKFHNGTNFNLLYSLDCKTISLNEQLRLVEKKYINFINKIRLLLDNAKSKNNVKNNLLFKYLVFEHLKDQFFTKDNITKNIYLSDTHKKIKNRFNKIEEECIKLNIKYKKSPYLMMNYAPLQLPSDDKYLPHVLLVENMLYLYSKPEERPIFVKLKSILPDSVMVESLKTNKIFEVKKQMWTKYFHHCGDDQFMWLQSFQENNLDTFSIFQYPLRPCLFTYHTIQGLTFGNGESLTLDLDCSSINAFYVALTRVKYKQQIQHIDTKMIESLLYTSYKNDEFVYKVGKLNTEFIGNILKNNIKNDPYENKFKQIDNVNKLQNITWGKIKKTENINEIFKNKSILINIVNFILKNKTILENDIDFVKVISLYKNFIRSNEINSTSEPPKKCMRLK